MANSLDPDQMHSVVCDPGLYCFLRPVPVLRVNTVAVDEMIMKLCHGHPDKTAFD